MTPSWYGDSVGTYDGDTLVIDTVGIKVGPYSMIDWFGTPFTKALHLVERYRLLDYESTIKALEWAAKEHAQHVNPYNGPGIDPSYKGKGLQIQLTVADEGAFTMPWSATITFGRSAEEWRERVCAGEHPVVPRTGVLGPDGKPSGFLRLPHHSVVLQTNRTGAMPAQLDSIQFRGRCSVTGDHRAAGASSIFQLRFAVGVLMFAEGASPIKLDRKALYLFMSDRIF